MRQAVVEVKRSIVERILTEDDLLSAGSQISTILSFPKPIPYQETDVISVHVTDGIVDKAILQNHFNHRKNRVYANVPFSVEGLESGNYQVYSGRKYGKHVQLVVVKKDDSGGTPYFLVNNSILVPIEKEIRRVTEDCYAESGIGGCSSRNTGSVVETIPAHQIEKRFRNRLFFDVSGFDADSVSKEIRALPFDVHFPIFDARD